MKVFSIITIITMIVVVSLCISPKPANAGFFSFFEKLFGMKQAKNEAVVIQNSQTMALIKSVLNSDTSPGIGGGDITIVNNNALLPESGPLGTMADIEEATSNNGQISIYVVREGDNLSQIAQMFNVSVNTIIWMNDIKRGSLIKSGQTLVILPVSGVQYVVKKSDTLASIAKKHKGETNEIIDYNGLTEGSLTIGKTIIIPNGIDPYTRLTSVSSTKVRGASGPSYAGYYIKPVSGAIKSQGLHGYNAVDLAVSCGTPIVAAASGDVTISRNYGWNGGYGKYIVIKHPNGTQTLYSHLSSNIVSTGWHVVKGQVIGYVGNTGKSTGCHVHFEVRGAKNPF